MKALLFFSFVVMFVGCATIPQGTTPSSSPLISENGTAKTYEIIGNSEGSAGHFTLFGFIPFGRTDIDDAIHSALAPYQGDNLINVHYYVNSAFYFIGNSTSITVKGDVVKYTDKEKHTDTKKTILYNPINVGNYPYHRLSFGSAIDGLSADYTFAKPLNEFLFFSITLGYKSYKKKETYSYYFYYNNFSYEHEYKFNAIPIAFNIGVNAKKLLDIPVNPYAAIGVTYIPLIGDGNSDQWDQVGMNFNIGVDYELIKGLAVGLDYRYLKSFIELGYSNDNKGIGFSNFNLCITFYP